MPNERDLPSRYGISKARYRELLYFVRQYDEKKALIKSSYTLSATAYSGMPSAHNNSSPVERSALRFEQEKADVELIERCVHDACMDSPGMYDYILKAVAKGIHYKNMSVPCGRNQFFEYKRIFFLILNERKR